MLARFEGGPVAQPARKPASRWEVVSLYLLIGATLLVALSIVALHPDDDRLLVVGVVLLTVAVAIWLPVIILVPVVVAIWLIPPSIHEAVDVGSLTRTLVATLVVQLGLACATRVAYTTLRARLFQPQVILLPADSSASVTQSVEPERLRDASILSEPQPRVAPAPLGRVLGMTEARRLLDRLMGLDSELRRDDDAIRRTLEGCLRLQLEYQRLARPRDPEPPRSPFRDQRPAPFERAQAG